MLAAAVFKALAAALLAAATVHGAPSDVLMDCAHPGQLKAASNMCSSHGTPGNHIACMCQSGAPVCVVADMVDHKTAAQCDPKAAATCASSCNTNLIAIKCEGSRATKCLGIDPAVKKTLLSQI